MNWISVNDRLPEGFWAETKAVFFKKFSEQVNIFVDNGVVGTGAYNRETQKWFVGDLTEKGYQELVTTVTHWQPLPLPPDQSEKLYTASQVEKIREASFEAGRECGYNSARHDFTDHRDNVGWYGDYKDYREYRDYKDYSESNPLK